MGYVASLIMVKFVCGIVGYTSRMQEMEALSSRRVDGDRKQSCLQFLFARTGSRFLPFIRMTICLYNYADDTRALVSNA
jgi:hypothetical protein